MIRYALDLYPSDDPKDGARLARFTYTGTAGALQMAEVEGQANGTGRGIFSIRATSPKAAVIDPAGLQYVRTVRIDTSVVDGATLSGFDELPLSDAGFWIESGQFDILIETGTELLTLGGTGTMAYFQRAVMDKDSWIDDPFIGTDPQPEGWPLYLAGTGNELGAILWRVLHELEEPGRHQNPVPAMSIGFTHLVDSNGNPWVRTSGDFTAQVGESVYSIMQRLMGLGLYIEVDSHTFEVRAYEPETHRRDRTGGAFAADVIRFEAGVNIKSDATRAIEPRVRRNAVIVGSNGVWEWVTDPTVLIPWEGGLTLDDESGASLADAGAAQLAARSDAGDIMHLRMQLGDDPANGRYKPFEDDGIRLDDIVTVDTGSGQWDHDEQDFPVANLKLVLRQGGDWDCWVDLGSTYTSMQERAFQAAPVKAHNHPPNPKLCPPTTPPAAASCAANPSQLTELETENGDFELGDGTNWTGAVIVAGDPQGVGGSWQAHVTSVGAAGWVYSWPGNAVIGRTEVIRVFVASSGGFIRFGSMATPGGGAVAGDYTEFALPSSVPGDVYCVEWTPTTAVDNVKVHIHQSGSGVLQTDNLKRYIGGGGSNPHNGISPMAARCDHTHPEEDESVPEHEHGIYLTEAEHAALDHSVLGYWEPVTNGNVGSPEIVFEDGDVVMEWVPA